MYHAGEGHKDEAQGRSSSLPPSLPPPYVFLEAEEKTFALGHLSYIVVHGSTLLFIKEVSEKKLTSSRLTYNLLDRQ
jgi:hypothetical protein